jgi:hypothetical protein
MSGTALVLSGFSGFIPGLRDAQLEKSFNVALHDIRTTPFKRDLPPGSPEVKTVDRSFPWQRTDDSTPIPGYTGHITQLHDFKFERTYGKAAQAASEYARPHSARSSARPQSAHGTARTAKCGAYVGI